MSPCVSLRPAALLLAALLLAGCASTEVESTTAPWYLDTAIPAPQRVIVADVLWPPPVLSWIEDEWAPVPPAVAARLREGGIEVVDDPALFRDAWQTALTRHGEYYDERRGRVDDRRFTNVVIEATRRLAEQGIDAVIFTQIVVRQAPIGGGQRRVLRFDGVQRRPALRGSEVPIDFDWLANPLRTASLTVHVVTPTGVHFRGTGGIAPVELLDIRTASGRTRRMEEPFDNADFIAEGVALALHPLVRYPQHPLAR